MSAPHSSPPRSGEPKNFWTRRPNREPGEDDPEPCHQDPDRLRLAVIDSATLNRANYRLNWLIQNILVQGQPAVIGGPKKTLKTGIVIDLALSIATGTPFLGTFPVAAPCRVLVLTGESGEGTIQETARRITKAKGVDLEAADVRWCFTLPKITDPKQLAALQDALAEHTPAVAVIDPLYLSLLAGQEAEGLQASNLYHMGPLLSDLARSCLEYGATPVLVHHFKQTRKDPYAEPQLEDLAFSGIQEFARQWILLGRREPFDPDSPEGMHRLWLSVGGSVGHHTVKAVDVTEGKLAADFSGRTWEVSVTSAAAARAEAAEAADATRRRQNTERDKADERRVVHTLETLLQSGRPVSKTRLRDSTQGIGKDRFGKALARLLATGEVHLRYTKIPTAKGAHRDAECVFRGPPPDDENLAA